MEDISDTTISKEEEALFLQIMDYHKQHPEISLKYYLKYRVVELGEEVLQYKRVYLDTKFWIFLRDASIGNAEKADHQQLYDLITKLVNEKKILCPISQAIFMELWKKGDASMRLATFKLIENFSKGITIQTEHERRATEIGHFLKQDILGEDSVYPLEQLVWTTISYVLGFRYFTYDAIPQEQALLIQKGFIDVSWMPPLEELEAFISDESLFEIMNPKKDMEILADKRNRNQGKFGHAHEIRSYQDAFMKELAGILNLYEQTIADIQCEMYQSKTGETVSDEDKKFLLSSSIKFVDLILSRFGKDTISTQLPTFRVGAAISAIIRLDTKRKYKPNDLYDIEHARAALPYFDYFLTERSLKNLITKKPLNFNEIYSTQVISDEGEAVEELSKLL